MNSKIHSIPDALNRHLSSGNSDGLAGLALFIEQGADLVTPEAVAALRSLHRALEAKIASLSGSERLRSRLVLLSAVFDEAAANGQAGSRAHREIAFALLYFLKGADRIPDTVPEIGLLDDAMIVQLVLQRNAAMLRATGLRHGLPLPAEVA
jgi:uncharacterized membrane protein YkvA (DUF1232 family)